MTASNSSTFFHELKPAGLARTEFLESNIAWKKAKLLVQTTRNIFLSSQTYFTSTNHIFLLLLIYPFPLIETNVK